MLVKLYKDRNIEILDNPGVQNENNVEIMQIEIPEEYQDYNKKIVFILPTTSNNIVWDFINEDNTYIIRRNVTQYPKVQFYIWLTRGENDFRSVTVSLSFRYNTDASNEITEEEQGAINTILAELDEALTQTNNLDIDVNKVEHTATVTLTKKDGTSKSAQILDGEKGDTGEPGYTPQRGIDYWTAQDKQEILEDAIGDLQEYINKPFVSFRLQNGNLIVEVEEYGNNN